MIMLISIIGIIGTIALLIYPTATLDKPELSDQI